MRAGPAPTPRRFLAACLSAAWFCAGAALLAGDPNAEFMAALHKAHFDDVAVAYVDWVQTSPLMTEAFRDQLPYERAVSQAAQARSARTGEERSRLLASAATNFEEFAANDPDAPTTLDSLRQSANLYAELALATLRDAERSDNQAGRETARKHFDHATRIAEDLLEECAARLAKLPKPANTQADSEAKAQREQLRNRQAEAGFFVALISFERSNTFDAKSPGRAEALDDAWDNFGKLVAEYGDRTVIGASSKFYQGRCAQEKGDFAKALGCYEVLTKAADANPEFRVWTARAERRQAECLIAIDKPDEAIRGGEEFLASSRPAEREQAEWLEVAYQVAQAYQRQLKEIPAGQSSAKRIEAKVRELLASVAGHPNDFQRDARVALAGLRKATAGGSDFKNFADAFAAGKAALELMNSSLMAAKVARQNNPEAVKDLEEEAAASKEEARRAFTQALARADRQTPIAELNVARYYLGWLFWEEGRIEEAAVLGEFIASRYPESEFGPGAAKIALAAWEKLYQQSHVESGKTGSAFAAKKLVELSQLIATRWPDAPEAAAAINILINVAIRDDRIDEAEQLLAKLPEGARAGAELSLGSALWTQYLNVTKDRANDFDEAANKLREKASALLTRGFAGVRKQGKPTMNAAVGALYLVQMQLLRGDWQGALDVLEDKAVGPLAMVNSGENAAEEPKFVLETYKVALRAYLSAQPPQREKAQQMMQALDAFVAAQGGDAAAEQVMGVYVGVGLQLQRQLKDLTAAGNLVQAQQVAIAFGDVLDRMAGRPDAGSWKIQNWIAQTNLQIGQGLKGEQAAPYFKRARQSYEAVLAAAEKGGEGAPDATVIGGVHKRLGDCLVALGEYQAGIDQYTALLRDNPSMLDVQQAAAAAFQTWGTEKKLEPPLSQAIRGAVPLRGGKTVIWGWLRLASAADVARRRAAADPAAAEKAALFENLFFEARYNAAQCRFLVAQLAKPEERQEQLTGARQIVVQLMTLNPDLGGPKWKSAFEALLKEINAELEKK
jgi:tetratricopeptide (TPR) repeat protein